MTPDPRPLIQSGDLDPFELIAQLQARAEADQVIFERQEAEIARLETWLAPAWQVMYDAGIGIDDPAAIAWWKERR